MNVHISGATSFIGKAFIQYCQNYPHILINRLDRKSLETLNVNKLKGSNSFILATSYTLPISPISKILMLLECLVHPVSS